MVSELVFDKSLHLCGHFQATDSGGSMTIHVFGAYFGLMVSRITFKPSVETSVKDGSVYHSDLFAMIGK